MGKRQESRAKRRQKEALFRHQLISRVVVLELCGAVRSDAVREVADDEHFTSDGGTRRVSVRTLYRWLAAYGEAGELANLEPARRKRTGTSVALPEVLVEYIREEKKRDPRASSPELIRRAKILNVIDPMLSIDRTTVWRACKRMSISMRRRPQKNEGDMRRFAYPNRMMMVLCDGKHFRAGGTRKKRVALFYLDDATRRALHVVVGSSESTELFLWGFFELLKKHGYMNVIYMDHGAGFISHDTKAVIASMPHVYLINGAKAYPQGHGKVERFNQTALAAVLRSLDGAAEVDPNCRALTLRLQHFLDNQYNNWPHDSLGNQTPKERWNADERPLRFPESVDELRDKFVVTEARKVSRDHIISYEGTLYEVPRGLGGEWIDVQRQLLTAALFILHDGRLVRLHPVDLAANAKTRRARRKTDNDEPVPGDEIPKTAATLAYEKDFAPLVDPDGGFTDKDEE
jgi:putative transposase